MQRSLLLLGTFLFAGLTVSAAQAQDSLPEMPPPLRNLVNEGAQVRYLGNERNLDAWLTIKNGQEQYFYVMPDKKTLLMGLLFDEEGTLITAQQVKRLQSQGDTLLDTLTALPTTNASKQEDEAFKFKTPSEQLYTDLQNSNWVALGKADAPVMYAFIDPQCPHCHAFIDALRTGRYLEDGKVQLRMIPVGFRDETKAQAAFLIASPDPQGRWFAHMDGDENALPAKSEIGQQGVQRNLAIMQSWKFDVTPMIIYRAKDDSVKLVRGTPQDIPGVLNDVGGAN